MEKQRLDIERLIMRIEIYDEMMACKFRWTKTMLKDMREFYYSQLIQEVESLPLMQDLIEHNKAGKDSAKVVRYLNTKN